MGKGRALRILNVTDAPAGVQRLSPRARGVAAADLSTAPCEDCPARCCHMRAVVSVVAALRVSAATGRGLLDHVEATRWTPALDTLYAWPFKLDDGRHVFTFRRPGGACTHLRDYRCTIYDARPDNCRLFPFVVDDGHGVLRGGTQEHCPVQWLATDALRASLARDVERYREDRALELAIVRFWNRGARARSLAGLVAWLEGHVANELGISLSGS